MDDGIDIEFSINGNKYLLSEIKSYWYRRSKLSFEDIEIIDETSEFDQAMNYILPNEYENVIKFFKSRLYEKALLNKFKEIIDAADYVNVVQKVKNPWDKGIKARKGIEF